MTVRRSIAVRPSIAFVLALVLVAPPAMLRGNNLLVLLMSLVLAAAIIGLIGPRLALRGLRVNRLLPRHGKVGESMRIRYRIGRTHGGGMPAFALRVDEHLGGAQVDIDHPAWVLHVATGDTVHGDMHVTPTQRGKVMLNGATLGTGFPFGLWRRSKTLAGAREVVVHPRTVPVDRAIMRSIRGRGLDGPRSGRHRGHGEEWYATRPARPGDRLRDIAWRISAHRDELIALERTTPQPPRIRVVLDLRRATAELDESDFDAAREREEQAIILAASVLQAGHEAGDEIGMCVLGIPAAVHAPRRGSLHLDRMLSTLALLDLDTPRVNSAPPKGERAGAVVVQPDRVRPLVGFNDALHLSARTWFQRAGADMP